MSSPCTRRVQHTKIKVEEKGRKAVFRNPERKIYDVSQIDNCIVKSGIRSDCLVSEVGVASVLVELKGSDVAHACEQLMATIENQHVKPLLQKKIGFLVVCSRYPRFDTFVAKAKQDAARRYKAGFHIVCDQRELDIINIADIGGDP